MYLRQVEGPRTVTLDDEEPRTVRLLVGGPDSDAPAKVTRRCNVSMRVAYNPEVVIRPAGRVSVNF